MAYGNLTVWEHNKMKVLWKGSFKAFETWTHLLSAYFSISKRSSKACKTSVIFNVAILNSWQHHVHYQTWPWLALSTVNLIVTKWQTSLCTLSLKKKKKKVKYHFQVYNCSWLTEGPFRLNFSIISKWGHSVNQTCVTFTITIFSSLICRLWDFIGLRLTYNARGQICQTSAP